MEKGLLSIIILVDKFEKHLKDCLNFIIGQKFTQWECLLLDDESHDYSFEKCKSYAEKDLRFKYLRKKSRGQISGIMNFLVGYGRYVTQMCFLLLDTA